MSSYKISIRYAKSLLSLAVENKKVEEVKRDFDLFNMLCDESRPLKLFLRNPVIPNHRKTAILRKIFTGRFDPITMDFLDIVTRKNRENYLIEIAAIFIDMYREYKGIVIARLQSSVKFSETARKKLIAIIKENVGLEKTVEIREQINRDLIGGFVLTIGDKQVDDSVQNKLKFFRQKLIVK
jgi:F-type H+-transporting ATPase subunit delta